jgi:hypothetical protein
MRALLGVIGATAIVCAVEIVRWDARRLHAGASRAWGIALDVFMCVIAAGGVRLLVGAVRGRIYMRENGRGARGA